MKLDTVRAPASRRDLGVLLAVVVAASAAVAPDARADAPPPDWSYLYDGGAIAFMYVPIAVTLGLRLFVEPPDSPRFFDASEGGERFTGDSVPEPWVAGYVVGAGLSIAIIPDDGRWLHLKGFAEAQFTTLALTEIAKNTFGRHRPHYSDNTVVDERRSFFSGHASMTFATSTYLGMYLHGHVFKRWRDQDQAFAWWEVAPLGAIAVGSVAVAYSRVEDNRHHPSDVATGALVGAGMAALFYTWQESNLGKSSDAKLSVAPSVGGLSVGLAGKF